MDEFLSHPEKRASIIKKGLARAKDFSWDDMGAAVLEEYRKLEPTKKAVSATKNEMPAETPGIASEPLENSDVQDVGNDSVPRA